MMINNRIGFKVCFNEQALNSINESLQNYTNLFNTFELKTSNDFFNSMSYLYFVKCIQSKSHYNFSIHLPKNLFINNDINSINNIIEKINLLSFIPRLNLIVHLPSTYDKLDCFFKYLPNILTKFPKNCNILLENPVIQAKEVKLYLTILNSCLYTLNLQYKNLGICIDLGHICFSLNKKTTNDVINLLAINSNIVTNIQEIHLHDYNITKDHLKLGYGNIDLLCIKSFIKDNNLTCNIIIECTLESLVTDGNNQIQILRS